MVVPIPVMYQMTSNMILCIWDANFICSILASMSCKYNLKSLSLDDFAGQYKNYKTFSTFNIMMLTLSRHLLPHPMANYLVLRSVVRLSMYGKTNYTSLWIIEYPHQTTSKSINLSQNLQERDNRIDTFWNWPQKNMVAREILKSQFQFGKTL